MNIVLIGVNQRRVESGHCHVVLVLSELNAYLLWEMYRKAYRSPLRFRNKNMQDRHIIEYFLLS